MTNPTTPSAKEKWFPCLGCKSQSSTCDNCRDALYSNSSEEDIKDTLSWIQDLADSESYGEGGDTPEVRLSKIKACCDEALHVKTSPKKLTHSENVLTETNMKCGVHDDCYVMSRCPECGYENTLGWHACESCLDCRGVVVELEPGDYTVCSSAGCL